MLNIAVAAATSRLQSSDTWVPTVTQTMVWEARKQSVIISWQLFFSLPSSFKKPQPLCIHLDVILPQWVSKHESFYAEQELG